MALLLLSGHPVCMTVIYDFLCVTSLAINTFKIIL